MSAGAVKWIEPLFFPVGLIWLLFVLMGARAAVKKRRGKAALFLGVAAVLTALGSTKLPFKLLARLERPYANVELDRIEPADAVIMLGGTMAHSENDPFRFEFGPAADRALTAAELVRQGKADTLVLGGGGAEDRQGAPWSEAAALENWFEAWSLGIPEIVRLNPSMNTHDEAVQVKALMRDRGWDRILLVTSAYHMRRSAGLFQTLEIPFDPVACDFVGIAESGYHPTVIPRNDGVQAFGDYLHEVMGWFYYRARGWVE